MTSRNEKIEGLLISLNALHAVGQMRYGDYSFLHDAINDLRDPEPTVMLRDADFQPGETYWVSFPDGSRILVEAKVDSRGDVDIYNDAVAFSMWVGRSGAPMNREHLASVEPIAKDANADARFNAGFDALEELAEHLTLERDCE